MFSIKVRVYGLLLRNWSKCVRYSDGQLAKEMPGSMKFAMLHKDRTVFVVSNTSVVV